MLLSTNNAHSFFLNFFGQEVLEISSKRFLACRNQIDEPWILYSGTGMHRGFKNCYQVTRFEQIPNFVLHLMATIMVRNRGSEVHDVLFDVKKNEHIHT